MHLRIIFNVFFLVFKFSFMAVDWICIFIHAMCAQDSLVWNFLSYGQQTMAGSIGFNPVCCVFQVFSHLLNRYLTIVSHHDIMHCYNSNCMCWHLSRVWYFFSTPKLQSHFWDAQPMTLLTLWKKSENKVFITQLPLISITSVTPADAWCVWRTM